MAGPSTRKTAKQVIEKFINTAILKIEVCGPEAAGGGIMMQLAVYRQIAREVGWTEMQNKIDRVLNQQQPKGTT